MSEQHACIHCGSTDLGYSDARQGFGAGKAVAGALVFGPLGLVAGAINSNKRRVHVRCNACLEVFGADDMLDVERRAAAELQRERASASVERALSSTPAGMVAMTASAAAVLAGLSYLFLDIVYEINVGGFGVRFVVATAFVAPLVHLARRRARRQAAKG